MKTLVMMLLAVAGFAHAQEVDLMTGPFLTTDRFFFVRSDSCRKIFYIPRDFRVDSALSSILTRPGGLIQINVTVVPEWNRPQMEDESAASAWARQDCPTGVQTFESYPSLLQSLAERQTLPFQGLRILSTADRSGGAKFIQLELNPRQISLNSALSLLQLVRPDQSFHVFHKNVRAAAALTADYSAAADFVTNHYTQRTCWKTKSCTSQLIGPDRCDEQESCQDTPLILQALQTAGLQSGFNLTTSSQPGVPDSVLQSLQERLVSRLILSLFVETSRIQVADTMQITLGMMKRNASGVYRDWISETAIDDELMTTPISIKNLAEFARPELTRIYKALKL